MIRIEFDFVWLSSSSLAMAFSGFAIALSGIDRLINRNDKIQA
jgi:hypothetical protein